MKILPIEKLKGMKTGKKTKRKCEIIPKNDKYQPENTKEEKHEYCG